MILIIFFLSATVLTFILSGSFYYAANKNNFLLDFPNSRSSHKKPTLKGGGVVLILSFAIMLITADSLEIVKSSIYTEIFLFAVLIGLVGFIDDVKDVNPFFRLIIHLITAILAVSFLGGFGESLILGESINLGWYGNILAVLYIVWMLNLYNFMDGIDGLASIQAITVCISFGLITWSLIPFTDSWIIYLLLASCALGFLGWNFPKAKIFLGDAGSGFFGIILALFSLEVSNFYPELFWSFLILMSVFIVDATLTLVQRLFNGENFYEAHSNHAYQLAARRMSSHMTVTLLVLLINLLWLTPLAFLVAFSLIQGIVGLLISIFPLIIMCIYLKVTSNIS